MILPSKLQDEFLQPVQTNAERRLLRELLTPSLPFRLALLLYPSGLFP